MNARDTSLLVVVDESRSSQRAIAYVARLIGRRKGFRLCLGHYLPPVPPALLEFRGAENPDEEKRLDAEHGAKRRQFLRVAREAAEVVLAGAISTLCKAGVSRGAIETRFFEPVNGSGVAERILTVARASGCRTVITGRESGSWWRQLAQGDLAEELVRRARGFAIWVIE